MLSFLLVGLVLFILILITKAIFSKVQKKSTTNLDISLLPFKTLPFKSSNEAFEYIKEYFTLKPIHKKSAFYGKVFFVHREHSAYLVEIYCLINGKPKSISVFAYKNPECKLDIFLNDLVYVGIVKTGLYFGDELINEKNKDIILEKFVEYYKNISLGTILKKSKLDLNLKSGHFEWH